MEHSTHTAAFHAAGGAEYRAAHHPRARIHQHLLGQKLPCDSPSPAPLGARHALAHPLRRGVPPPCLRRRVAVAVPPGRRTPERVGERRRRRGREAGNVLGEGLLGDPAELVPGGLVLASLVEDDPCARGRRRAAPVGFLLLSGTSAFARQSLDAAPSAGAPRAPVAATFAAAERASSARRTASVAAARAAGWSLRAVQQTSSVAGRPSSQEELIHGGFLWRAGKTAGDAETSALARDRLARAPCAHLGGVHGGEGAQGCDADVGALGRLRRVLERRRRLLPLLPEGNMMQNGGLSTYCLKCRRACRPNGLS